MTPNKPTIAVLMSTYNGEKYIREQLESIFCQKGVNVRLFVRDDGSTDDTVKILEEYSSQYNITILIDNENVGPGESFMRLLYKYAYEKGIEFFAFADQDDIWIENKLLKAVQTITEHGENTPFLYGSNQFIYENGINKGNRYSEHQNVDLLSHINRNTIAGCTFVFNRELALVIANVDRPDKRIIRYRLHDAWLMLVAIVNGHVFYDEESYMLYRIHQENVVGIRKVSLNDKLKRIARMIDSNSSNIRMVTAIELLRLYPSMNEENKRVLRLFANYKDSLCDRIALLHNKEIIAGCMEPPLIFTLKVLLGLV